MSGLEPLIIAGLVAGGMSAGSQVVGGVRARNVARTEAKSLRQIGAIEAHTAREAGARLRASQAVAFAKAGVDVGSGTPLEVFAATARETELEAARALWYRRQQASFRRSEGEQALFEGILGAGTSLLSAGVQAFGGAGTGGSTKPLPRTART